MPAAKSNIHIQPEPGPGAAMLSHEERFLTPKAIAILDFENELSERRYGETVAHQQSQDRIKLAIADKATLLSSVRRVEKPDKELESTLEAQMAAEEAKLRQRQIEFDEKRKLRAGSRYNDASQFARTNHKKTRDANTTDELLAGNDPRGMVEHQADKHKVKRDAKAIIIKAKRPAAEFLPVIDAAVDRFSDKTLAMQLAFVKNVHLREDGRIEAGKFQLPELSIANALGGLTAIPDAMALLCTIDPTPIKKRLRELALRGHDDSKALPMAERKAKLAAIDAELLEIERKSEFWVRRCFALGLEPGPRLSAHPLAVLDLEFE